MITSIRLQNFKGHRDTTVPFGRFTALVGPNGAGKTSVLEALALQSRLVREDPSTVLGGDSSPLDLYRRGSGEPLVITSGGTSAQIDWSLRLSIDVVLKPSSSWRHVVEWQLGSQVLEGMTNPDNIPSIRDAVGAATLYKLSARNVAAAAHGTSIEPVVEFDGMNTAVALAAIKMGRDEDFARIEQEMRVIVPNVQRVRIKPAAMRIPIPKNVHPGAEQDAIGNKVFFDFRGAQHVPAHLASEGTLVTFPLDNFCEWIGDRGGNPFFDVHRVYKYAQERGVRLPHNRFDGRSAAPGYLMARTAFLVARQEAKASEPIDAVILIWDADDQGDARRGGLDQARTIARLEERFRVVLGCPDMEREAWVLAGFEPEHKTEQQQLDEECRALGSVPAMRPTACATTTIGLLAAPSALSRRSPRATRCVRSGAGRRRRSTASSNEANRAD